MAGGVNEEEGAVDTCVDNVLVTHSSELFAEVSRVLVLDVFDDGVPAIFVVNLVSVTGGINNVQTEFYTILRDDVRDGMNVRRLSYRLISLETTL